MKRNLFLSLFLLLFSTSYASATVLFQDGFENSWVGDYAPGWVNADYRHGIAPVAQMMQQTTVAQSGSYGLKLIAATTIRDTDFWASVEVASLPSSSLDKRYNPYVSAWYYDDQIDGQYGQLYAVPDWVNLYNSSGEDWTDVQFGASRYVETTSDYKYVAVGENHPGWQDTDVTRSEGWHKLMFQLTSTGYIYFYIDDNLVGQSYRNDYENLGTSIGLYTMFQAPLSPLTDTDENPYTLWDNFVVGSSVPEPNTIALFGFGLLSLAGITRKKMQ